MKKIITIRGKHNVSRFLECYVIPEILSKKIIQKVVKEEKIEILFAVSNEEESEWLEKIESNWK